MNLIQIKCAVRANKVLGSLLERVYLTLTGQLKGECECITIYTPY